MRQVRLWLAHARAGIKRHDSSEVENNLYIPWGGRAAGRSASF